MASWSLEAYVDPGSPLEVDALARQLVQATGDAKATYIDALCPFDDSRLGVEIQWLDWCVTLMVRRGPDVEQEAIGIFNSRIPPAAARRRLQGCDTAIRVIFGSDDSRGYTNHMISIAQLLAEVSQNRVFDPRRKRFWEAM